MRENEGTIQNAFQNINGFGFDKEWVKYKRIFSFLDEYKLDILVIAECNMFCTKINSKERLHEKTRGWFCKENRSVI